MAEQSIPAQAYANGKPAALSTFTKAVYSLTPENEIGERLDHTLENIESRIKKLESTPETGFNLLVNSRFKYNGRNQNRYSLSSESISYTVDAWLFQSGAGVCNMEVTEAGITLNLNSVNQGISQVLNQPLLLGRTYTVSVKVNGQIYADTFSWQGDNIIKNYPSQGFSFAITYIDSIYRCYQYIDYRNQSSTVTLTAAKLELGSVSTLAADLATAQDETIEQLRLDMYDLDPGRPAYILTQNQNLLDNWYFVGGGSQQGGGQFPINQRGQTSYTGTGYGIDRWKAGDSRQTISVLANGISILNSSGNSVIFQTIAQNLINQKVTFSVQQSDGTIDILTNTFTGSGTQIIHQMTNGKGQIYLSDGASESGVGILASSGETVTITAAKLELGTRSTLARLVDGEWVLNDPPPNFQQELAKCQRYQISLSGDLVPATLIGTNTIFFFVSTPVTMRTLPTISPDNFSVRTVQNGGEAQSGFSFSVSSVKENGVLIAAQKQSHGLTDAELNAGTSGNISLLDANL